MRARILSIYCEGGENDYYYDLDGRIKKYGDFCQSTKLGNGYMHIKENDEVVYIVCRYADGTNEIRYKGKIIEVDVEQEKFDEFEHGVEDNIIRHPAIRIGNITPYEAGKYPIEKLREMGLISKHNQIHGDFASQELIEYIENDN